jgi:hypothetical protein
MVESGKGFLVVPMEVDAYSWARQAREKQLHKYFRE